MTATGRADPEQYEPLAVEHGPPALVLEQPSPIEARHAIRALAQSTGAPTGAGDDLVSAVSEVVTNAHSHGTPPVRLQAWVDDAGADADGHRLIVVVSDHGDGPTDRAIGTDAPVAREPGEGGFGLFLARQLCDDVTLGRADDTFRVRLVRSLA